jgi:hypothetical protein
MRKLPITEEPQLRSCDIPRRSLVVEQSLFRDLSRTSMRFWNGVGFMGESMHEGSIVDL